MQQLQQRQLVTGTQKYRLLSLGSTYAYRARPGKGLDDRRGQPCTVLILPKGRVKPANVLVQFPDGTSHVVSAGMLRPIPEVTT